MTPGRATMPAALGCPPGATGAVRRTRVPVAM